MTSFVSLPMFEVSGRPVAERVADWLARIASLNTSSVQLDDELAATIAKALACEGALSGALAHLETRTLDGQRVELSRSGLPDRHWAAAFVARRGQSVAVYGQSFEACLLDLSGVLEAKPYLGAPNAGLDYNAEREGE